MAFFVNRQMGNGMNSGSEDCAGGQVGLLGIGRDMLGIYRNKFRCRTCRNNNPHRGRQYLHLWG